MNPIRMRDIMCCEYSHLPILNGASISNDLLHEISDLGKEQRMTV